jgi:hypothetical protein
MQDEPEAAVMEAVAVLAILALLGLWAAVVRRR